MTGGGFVRNDSTDFRLSEYVPPVDVPASACTPCWGVSDPRCCQYQPQPRLLLVPDKPRRWHRSPFFRKKVKPCRPG
jgi:hypothetical protein